MPKTKAELLEENINLLKSALKGWAARLEFIVGLEEAPELRQIISEMIEFSG